jgi:hypothetical protein
LKEGYRPSKKGDIMKHFIFILMLAALLAACGPAVLPDTPISDSSPKASMDNNLYAPQAGDRALSRGNMYLDSANVLVMESFPVQISVNLKGSLPTPCNHLRAVIAEPDADKNIKINLYTVTDPNTMCTDVLQPFDVNLMLGSFPAGHYTVWVNGEKVGEFDS